MATGAEIEANRLNARIALGRRLRGFPRVSPEQETTIATRESVGRAQALRILGFLRFLLFQDETNTMHPLFARADRLSGEVIGAAIEVHRIMGPGLLESIELKAVQEVLPIHKAQLLSYMKLLNMPLGHLFNFHEVKLVEGIERLILPGANNP